MSDINNQKNTILRSTFIGFLAILMWSFSTTFTASSGQVPPFLLMAISMLIGSLPGIILVLRQPALISQLKQPANVWLVGVGGLFGYHFLYYTAFRNAPPAQAGLINYLWPLFIVLGSALMPGEKLRWFHLTGALMGFIGMLLVVMKSGGIGFDTKYTFGYLCALAAAFVWACYTLLSKRLSVVPTVAVGMFCLATSALAFISHFVFGELTIWPNGINEWASTIALGLFPMGLAFYCWDFGAKHGNIQILGTVSYATPMLSTIILIIFGLTQPTWQIITACLLITIGAVIASKDIIFKK